MTKKIAILLAGGFLLSGCAGAGNVTERYEEITVGRNMTNVLALSKNTDQHCGDRLQPRNNVVELPTHGKVTFSNFSQEPSWGQPNLRIECDKKVSGGSIMTYHSGSRIDDDQFTTEDSYSDGHIDRNHYLVHIK